MVNQVLEWAAGGRRMENSLGNSFLTALLLTGSQEQAETAVLRAIELAQSAGEEEAGSLHLYRAALAASEETPKAPRRAASPVELRRVLSLPPVLRQCFVLRFLAGLPRQVCAQLLRLDLEQLDEHLCAALRELPGVPA